MKKARRLPIYSTIIRIIKFFQKENLLQLFFIIVLLIITSSLLLAYFEPNLSLLNALWWSIVTLTTVGYGDITPTTLEGRVVGIIIMFFGIGLLGMFTATIASIFVEKKLKENKGMKSFHFENHIILCEWNHRTREILAQLRMDERTATAPIVLIANIPEKPVDDDNLYFIQGEVTEETLTRANLKQAKTVVILGNDRLEANARDAQVVLATLTVESINPEVYTIVELVDEANVQHCKRAHADEIIVGSEFSTHLISRAALDHGISIVISELLSSRVGNDIYKIPVPIHLTGKRFIEVFSSLKEQYNSIALSVQRGNYGAVISNPGIDFRVEKGDFLIVISEKKPDATKPLHG
ncbi:MAG: cag pathogenicity island protein Cag26 [Calditrichaeota bacterium]|nr:MAG: cag pathogenicity island protein Cag26 [Calditrichota bacterium]